ncbi:hypothetical protein [Sphingomonas spermidinifaciens]|nr:hypothetical protein [Sphingomonas spermidinifaciens]
MGWRYDAEQKTLRVSVRPVVWQPGDWSTRPATTEADERDDAEAVEGYWVPRPWTSSETCPPRRQATITGAEAVTLPGQTLALAQFFDASDSRQARRGDKPFESVTRVAPEDVQAERGFHLRISGRVAETPDGSPIACRQPAGSEQRPICVIAVKIDEVAIINPVREETLATWTTAQPEAR